MPLSEFITGYRQTALQKDEFIETVIVPLPAADEKVKMYKVSKRHDMDISTVSAAFRLKINLENKVEKFAAFYGGMAGTTIEANETKSFLLAKQWSQTTIEEAMSILIGEFNPISDARSGAEFRNIAAANLLQQFFNDTKSEMS
jgi:xanthine dehydrogenase small subunit